MIERGREVLRELESERTVERHRGPPRRIAHGARPGRRDPAKRLLGQTRAGSRSPGPGPAPSACSLRRCGVGAHSAHLSRVFRRQIGVPIGEYVHRLRGRYASEELSRPGARLADVAADAGFADQSHLTRVFKRVTGVTPGDFRQLT